MRLSGCKFVFILFIFYAAEDLAQSQWSFELCTGLPFNIPTPLGISQSGQEDIHLTAQYYSEPFVTPYFWIWRISIISGGELWSLEAVHHKIFLRNKPKEVTVFSISHGLNIITLNRGWILNDFILKAGAGIVIAHPENTVRQKELNEDRGIFTWGYYLSGPACNFSLGKNLYLSSWLYVTCEIKLLGSYSYIPAAEGNAKVLNAAAVLSAGIGFDFSSGSK